MNGCKAGEKINKLFKIQIPKIDFKPYFSKYVPVSQDEMLLLKTFSCSVSAKLFKIEYFLKCFVKHDAWNEFG